MSRKTAESSTKTTIVIEIDAMECPFREFRDNELQPDTWGMSTADLQMHSLTMKTPMKVTYESQPWVDEQTQPLPRSVRHFLHGWIRAEELAQDKWDAEVVIFEDTDGGKMSITDMQLSHTQVLVRSSFCRNVLSTCFVLERVESLVVEHQWELFTCSFTPEGWRPKYHIYSPGLKPGGGAQHKPVISKNGCYLVRLFYLGTWRCVWVNDLVPVDAAGMPLLPFSPIVTHVPAKPGTKIAPIVMSGSVIMWPLLLTKALLKLAVPDMNSDEDTSCVEDEPLKEFDFMHALTGCMNLQYIMPDIDDFWVRILNEVPLFGWDDDDETQPSTVKTRSTKKPTAKELAAAIRRCTMIYVVIKDTKELPSYYLPGITPGHEMSLLIIMARDLPLKKPLPEPEVALWKQYRWVDWARHHGLYEAFDCSRTRFLKVNGLLKLSYAPHLLDVQSTESITVGFIEEHVRSAPPKDAEGDTKKKEKKTKEQQKSAMIAANLQKQQLKEELREWVQLTAIHSLVSSVQVLYYPSMYNFTSAASNPPTRMVKALGPKVTDILPPKSAPLYLQLDGPEENKLRMSLAMMHPRVLSNCSSPVSCYVESAYLMLEKFEWFKDIAVPVPQAYIRTQGYQTVEVDFEPGRHFFRIWTHSRMHWHIMLLSKSTIILGSKDVIQDAAIRECPWASTFLLRLGTAFTNWIKVSRTNKSVIFADRDFFRSYQPDLTWDNNVVGYDQHLLHWMFRRALESLLSKTLNKTEFKSVSHVLRKYFCDPDFGFPKKPKPPKSVREIANLDICDCIMPETKKKEGVAKQSEAIEQEEDEQGALVRPGVMAQLLRAPNPPIASQLCELATEELPCGILKDEREKMIRKHEAAVVLQAHWRGKWARKCLESNSVFTSDIAKYVQEHAFGSIDALSNLMNEFFTMWPGAKYAYSVSSALRGVYGLQQHTGITPVTSKCKWIPHFQGVFFCHAFVKVHFDMQSSNAPSTIAIYDNDSGEQLPQTYNTHITFDFKPNYLGYTILGHGSLSQASGINCDAHWQLTVMSSIDGAFHICDNEDPCREFSLPHTTKLHIDDFFLPNKRNILGGIQISVWKHESVSFRAAATSPTLEMHAILRGILPGGNTEELLRCSGKGEIYWPFIRLEPLCPIRNSLTAMSGRELTNARLLCKSTKFHKSTTATKKSVMKPKINAGPRVYVIEVICPSGWPLSVAQWQRVDEVRNSGETAKNELQLLKKGVKEKEKLPKPGSAKEKEKTTQFVVQPQAGDACVELECAFAVGGAVTANRDNERDLEFANAIKAWNAGEPGRNLRGAQIREEFRSEFVAMPSPRGPTGSYISVADDEAKIFENSDLEETHESAEGQGPTPVTESDLLETTLESEEEPLYLLMPDHLRGKFVPLHFVPLCLKEKNEEDSVLVTPDILEAAKKNREARIEAALERMQELQLYNEEHILGRQKYRCQMLEKLFVDATLCPELEEAMEQREAAIATEVLTRNLSAIKKKSEAKKK